VASGAINAYRDHHALAVSIDIEPTRPRAL
jgi:hypothetical protein